MQREDTSSGAALRACVSGPAARVPAMASTDTSAAPSSRKRLPRAFGPGEEVRYSVVEAPLGVLLVAAGTRGVCAILMGDDAPALVADLARRFPGSRLCAESAPVEAAEVRRFLEAPASELALPLELGGTPFQQRVWAALQEIPAGRTESYTDVARRLGLPRSVRAVAQACGANAHAVAIPCHRVVRSDGGLSGYRWGVARKRQLLERERAP